MKSHQRGSVLIVSLLLLLVITIVGVSGILNTMSNERLASNQRQVTEAFMAAESGLVNAKQWLDSNRIMWGKHEESMVALSTLYTTTDSGARWWIESLEYLSGLNNIAKLTSCGTVAASGVERCVAFSYLQAKGAANLAALNLIGKNILFKDPASGAIRFIGEEGGPAIAINTDASSVQLSDLIDALNEIARKEEAGIALTGIEKKLKQVYANGGGIERVDFGDPFGDANKLSEFVDSVKSDYCGCKTTKTFCAGYSADPVVHTVAFCNKTGDLPNDLGVIGNEKLVYVESPPGETLTISFQGNKKGAGIMVVKGNVLFSGTPRYDGLLIVVGDSFAVSGGGNGGINGALAVTNFVDSRDSDGNLIVDDSGKAVKEFGDTSASFDGGGTSEYFYNEDRLELVRDKLLSASTKDLWKLGLVDDNNQNIKDGTILNWIEVIR